MSLKVTSVDGTEPITLDEAKQQCYILTSNTDTDIENLLDAYRSAARQYAENRTWLSILEKTYEYKLDSFPQGIIELPRPPVISVDSIEYVDTSENTQTLSDSKYRVDTDSYPARIENVDDNWPETEDQIDAVTITFKAGFTSNTKPDTQEDINTAMKMLIKYWYDNRDAVVVGKRSSIDVIEVPIGANALLDMHSVRRFA
jgi:uncharacterized phiE125 gp8 family phage protein